jgi:hypothetical protein
MESKVRELLYLKSNIAHCAFRRQVHIDTGDFQMAMYHQFMFHDYTEKAGAIMLSMTNQERADYYQAMLCWDYK